MRHISIAGAVALLASFNGNIGVTAEPIPLAARADPTVDLGYAIYQGSYDAETKVNTFKGYVLYQGRIIGHLE